MQDRPSSKKALLPSNLLSLAKALTAGKTRVLILQHVHPWPVKSRAYSVILRQKGSAQQGMVVYLTAFHIHSAPPAKVLLLFCGCCLPIGLEASLCWRSIFESTPFLWLITWIFNTKKLQGELCSFDSRNKRLIKKLNWISFFLFHELPNKKTEEKKNFYNLKKCNNSLQRILPQCLNSLKL